MKKNLAFITLFSVLLGLNSCPDYDKLAARGGLIGTKKKYVLVDYDGGKIVDVYKLNGRALSWSAEEKKYSYIDTPGNKVQITADKIFSLKNEDSTVWNQYTDYHADLDTVSYHEKRKLELEKILKKNVPDTSVIDTNTIHWSFF
ncbi:MAG: hypothetical protein ABIC91_01000 [Nanoarchaeota archaeon]|nr:hypothetical protein [Nanoarchaeota archaeon]MBU1030927.1 hypothetical protein [Nanoarchaeota archaeon]MBU1850468.1 hypothetical protein [Nanoarchaeota archaeon]